MRGWIGHVVAALASAMSMSVVARFAARVDPSMPYRRFPAPRIEDPNPVVFAGIAVVLAGLIAMRRWPRVGFGVVAAGLITYGLADAPAFGMFVPLSVGAAVLVARTGLPAACPLLALVPVATWSAFWNRPALGATDWSTWVSVLTSTVWTLLPALAVWVIGTRRRVAARERADALERAASDERLRLAREIHDVVGHSLSMISLQSGVALRVLDSDPGQARASLEAIRGASKDALGELRHTLGVFRGDEVPRAPTPTLAALPGLVEDVRAGGVRVLLSPLPSADGLGAAEQTAAYRIVQESLTNAVRHAPGQPVAVRITREGGALVVRVTNDLSAPAPAEPISEGGGLRGMRERVHALGGTLDVTRGDGAFMVTATLPPTDAEP